MLLQDVLLPPDTLSNRPAAAPSNNGFLYCITDQNNLLVRSNGTSWENYSSTISTGLTQLTGDVTAGPGTGSVAATIAANAVTSGKILDANVTYAKIQDVSAASRLLGRGSASGSGDVEELTISTGLTLTGTTLTAAGSGGTVTAVTASAPLASSGGATPDISLTVPSDATKFLDGTGAFDTVKDSDLSTSNITTNNVTIAKHGFAPILPNDATKYLDGTGAYTVPAGVSTGDVVGPASAVADDIATFNGTTGKLIKDGGKKIADLVLSNVAITPATKTKITYDAKGLVTVGADAVLADLAATTADFSMNSHKLTNVTDPASAQDAATKAYVDATKIVGIEVVIDGGGAT